MNEQAEKQLHDDLARLSTWDGPSPEVWRRAAERHDTAAARVSRWLLRPSALGSLAAAVVVLVGLVIVGSVGRWSDDPTQRMAMLEESIDGGVPASPSPSPSPSVAMQNGASGPSTLKEFDASIAAPSTALARRDGAEGSRAAFASAAESPTSVDAPLLDRMVTRRSSIEMRSGDVEKVVRRVTLLVSEARGEYVQQVSLTGETPRRAANITLRVASDRAQAVAASIRELGEVTTESSTGEDVTDQAVDLESRLRNAKRIEDELLKLLSSRANAPLADILQVGSKLAEVRETIERLQGQSSRLSRLAALATINVWVREKAPEPAPQKIETKPEEGAFERAWSRGVATLERSAARLLESVIGGAIWWVALALLAWIVGWLVARQAKKSAREDSPMKERT